jgi:hypothetical protein
MMRPVSLKVGAGDFALAGAHGGIAVSLVAGPCMHRRPFHGPPPCAYLYRS